MRAVVVAVGLAPRPHERVAVRIFPCITRPRCGKASAPYDVAQRRHPVAVALPTPEACLRRTRHAEEAELTAGAVRSSEVVKQSLEALSAHGGTCRWRWGSVVVVVSPLPPGFRFGIDGSSERKHCGASHVHRSNTLAVLPTHSETDKWRKKRSRREGYAPPSTVVIAGRCDTQQIGSMNVTLPLFTPSTSAHICS